MQMLIPIKKGELVRYIQDALSLRLKVSLTSILPTEGLTGSELCFQYDIINANSVFAGPDHR